MNGNATLTEALAALRARPQWLEAMLRDEVVLWLGSGISRAKFPPLPELLGEMVKTLWERAQNGDKDSEEALDSLRWRVLPWRKAEPEASPENWPQFWEGLGQLASDYAKVLDDIERSLGREPLLFELLQIDQRYGDPTVEPDAEHRFVALLHQEGVLREVVTTNWDSLVEVAAKALGQSSGEGSGNGNGSGVGVVKVVAAPEDLPRTPHPPRLLKIHGCARRALEDPPRYRPYLVATDGQVEAWSDDRAPTEPLRDQIRALLQTRSSVILGLSFQDANLRRQVREASASLGGEALRLVVGGGRLDEPVQQLVGSLHPEADRETCKRLQEEALIPLWAKPFLGALYVETLSRKVLGLTSGVKRDFWPLLVEGLEAWEDWLAARYDEERGEEGGDDEARWRRLVEEVPGALSRVLALFEGRLEALERRSDGGLHQPFSRNSLAVKAEAGSSGRPRAALLFTALAAGRRRSWWRLGAEQPAAERPESSSPEEAETPPHSVVVDELPVAVVQDGEVVEELWPQKGGLIFHARGRRRGWYFAPRRNLGQSRLPSYGLNGGMDPISLRSEMEMALESADGQAGEAFLLRLREIFEDAREMRSEESAA
ncbi:MAG: SIR2 family protein [Acidobacteriota bacterium]